MELYKRFLANRINNQDTAYEAAEEYLRLYKTDNDQYTAYLTKWVAAYRQALRQVRVLELLYNERKYFEAYELGREILTENPDNLRMLVHLGANGYLVAALKNAQLNSESLEDARKALQLIESGKTVEDWSPLPSKEAAMAYLNFTIGALTLEKEHANALKNLLKAVQVETPLKKSPFTYAYIAGAYETGRYAMMSEEYNRLYEGKDETPESKLALANINQIVDRMIDSYARAIALAGNDATFATPKADWSESLRT